jgi:hypothetical protein
MKNFAAGMFVFPHRVVPGRNGNVWPSRVRQRYAGDEAFPGGKVPMVLGKAGQGGKAWTFDSQPRWRSHPKPMPSSPEAMNRLRQFTHHEVRREWNLRHDSRPFRVL